MTQFSLFNEGPLVLLDDATGRIVYEENVIDAATADRWFQQLLNSTIWSQKRRVMYERELDVPRLTAHFGFRDESWPEPLAEAMQHVSRHTGHAFDSIGLNLYRDEHDSVAMHNDRLADLMEGRPIALLSLGTARRMLIRSKATPRRRFDLDLIPGSLLLMDWQSQHHYDHGIPKQTQPVSPRISVAFRARRRDD
ncbi:DNA-3-methyladenine glycosylase [Dyella jiangningensis]|nr:DNA-3-methyladenine glycosylase [Dyella jiangningensis]